MADIQIPKTVTLLVNGEFPSHPVPLEIFTYSDFLVCTDGSSDKAIAHDKLPNLVVGDLDSVKYRAEEYHCKVVQVERQDNTDLEKTLDYLIDNGVEKTIVLGITGGRDDQSLANMIILYNYSTKIIIQAVSDFSRIDFSTGKNQFSSHPGQTVSLLSYQPVDSITTAGLEYSMENTSLRPSGKGVSNKSLGTSFTIDSSGPVIVFRSH